VQCARTGSRICVLAEEIGKQLVFSTVDPSRGRLGELAKIDTNGVLTAWSLSPDGGRIALVENNSDSVRVLELPSKRVQVVRLTPPQKGLQMSAWSDDSKWLFLSSVRGEFKLLAMDASGHTRLLLENPSSWVGNPLPSPDGKRIAYALQVSEVNVTLLEHF
jgi:Tol biopolymer transport system component